MSVLLKRPAGPLRLNRRHYAARNLVGLWVGGEVFRDISGAWAKTAPTAGTPGTATSLFGKYTQFNGDGAHSPIATRALTTSTSLSVVTICRRDITPTGSGSGRVQVAYSTNNQGVSTGPELNLGNSFGAGADILKPRAVGGTVNAWLDGRKQAGVNPFTEEVLNGQWVCIGATHLNAGAGSEVMRIGALTNNAQLLTGGVAVLALFRGVLPDATMEALTRDPWGLVEGRAQRIRRIASVWSAAPAGGTDATAAGVTATLTASAIAGAASAASQAGGVTAVLSASAIAGAVTADSSAVGVTATLAASAIPGAASADSQASGVTATVTLAAIVGAASAAADATAAGVTATLAASAVSGAPSADSTAAGVTATLAASVVLGAATASSEAAGVTATLAASALAGEATNQRPEIPVRTAIIDAVTTALQTAALTIRGAPVTIERSRTDMIEDAERPLLAVQGGDMIALADTSDQLQQRYSVRVLLAGYLAAASEAEAEKDAAELHAKAIRALIRPDPDGLPASLMLADGVTEVWMQEGSLVIEPASVLQSETPAASMLIELTADVTQPWGNLFISA